MGLDDSVFETIRSRILSMEQLPTVSKAYSLIMREERYRTIERGQEKGGDITAAFAFQETTKTKVFSQFRTRQYVGGDRFCSHCNKSGHEVVDCFELHGYPV